MGYDGVGSMTENLGTLNTKHMCGSCGKERNQPIEYQSWQGGAYRPTVARCSDCGDKNWIEIPFTKLSKEYLRRRARECMHPRNFKTEIEIIVHQDCYLKEARAMLEGKHWEGKNKCVKLPGD